MKSPRMGRPRAKLPKAKTEVTVRMRRLLDFAHDGNVHEASQVSGVAYATLRDLYTGKSTNPNIRTLQTLAKAYGMYPGWFTDPNQPSEVPAGGYYVYIPGFTHGKTPQIEREAMIPHIAHPLVSVYVRLDTELEKAPQVPLRPIVGEVNNDRRWNRAIGEFLFAPLLVAEDHTRTLLIPDAAVWSRDRWEESDVLRPYVARLKALGRFWETVVDDVVAAIRATGRPLPRLDAADLERNEARGAR